MNEDGLSSGMAKSVSDWPSTGNISSSPSTAAETSSSTSLVMFVGGTRLSVSDPRRDEAGLSNLSGALTKARSTEACNGAYNGVRVYTILLYVDLSVFITTLWSTLW